MGQFSLQSLFWTKSDYLELGSHGCCSYRVFNYCVLRCGCISLTVEAPMKPRWVAVAVCVAVGGGIFIAWATGGLAGTPTCRLRIQTVPRKLSPYLNLRC